MPRALRTWRGQWVARVLLFGVAATPAGVLASTSAPSATEQLSQQLRDADEARADGQLTEAAQGYVDAYRLTRRYAEYRNSALAKDAAIRAYSAYHDAFEASDGDYALCERSRAFLQEFVTEWERAGNAVPQSILDELHWLDERLAERPVEPVPEPEPPVSEPEPPIAEPDPTPRVEPPRPDGPAPDEDRSQSGSNALNIALVAGGAAAVITGGVLAGLGAPLDARAQQYRTDTQQTPEFTERGAADQAVFTAALDDYVEDERRRGTILMATGGALLGIGVAAVVVGSVRWARRSRGATRLGVSGTLTPTSATARVAFVF